MFFPLILLTGVADGSPDAVSVGSLSQCSFSVLPDPEGEVGPGSWSEFDTGHFVPSGGNCQACPSWSPWNGENTRDTYPGTEDPSGWAVTGAGKHSDKGDTVKGNTEV